MKTLFMICITILLINCLESAQNNYFPCKPCKELKECDQKPPQVCIWGEARDFCNRRICTKGPGEMCGGFKEFLGICGEGMFCKNDPTIQNSIPRCHGCSIQTLQCYTSEST